MMARLDFAKSYEDTAKRAKSLCVFVGLRGLIDFPKAGDLKTRLNLSVCADKSHTRHTLLCVSRLPIIHIMFSSYTIWQGTLLIYFFCLCHFLVKCLLGPAVLEISPL